MAQISITRLRAIIDSVSRPAGVPRPEITKDEDKLYVFCSSIKYAQTLRDELTSRGVKTDINPRIWSELIID